MKAIAYVALLAALPAAGCSSQDGALARYRLERDLWNAQVYERRINISFLRGAGADTQKAISAFRYVLAQDPLAAPGAAGWDAAVVNDIREIQVVSRLALATLYFVSERYADAGTLYRETLESSQLSPSRSLDARLGVARSLYLTGETDAVLEQCAAIFAELVENPAFWARPRRIDPVFLNVPVALVRMYAEAGDSASAGEYAHRARDFYARIVRDQAGTPLADQALLGTLQVALARAEWSRALRDVDDILATPDVTESDRQGFTLLKGEIYAFALNDTAAALPVFAALSANAPGSGVDAAARYDVGAVRMGLGQDVPAMRIFRELEHGERVPAAIAARAMLSRATILERRGNWDDAYALYVRVGQLYPYTSPAIEAPLRVTRYYTAHGQAELARRTLDRSRDYYLSLLERGSPFEGDRLVVQAALAETFLAAGRAADVASLLGSDDRRWDETSAAAGMLKSAEVYATAVGDTLQAVAMLKKCIERFPETRYASVAQHRLDVLEGHPE
ncbi:MAG TPA: tetratricopeptide repeat protein [Candidatus Krumholzibacteria bacterium]|nr:tetratricopeptide repeat protein [Candidatus Krumholzibacteria bacterium]